jgi:hypothetical protein
MALENMNKIAEDSPQPGTNEVTEASPTPPVDPSIRNKSAAASQAPAGPNPDQHPWLANVAQAEAPSLDGPAEDPNIQAEPTNNAELK